MALAVVAGAAVALHLYQQADAEICRRIEVLIAQHYPDLQPNIRAARLEEGKGIRIYDLSIVEAGAAGPGAELLHVEETLLECSTAWKDLIGGNPAIRRVTVHRPTLRLTRRPDGAWSAAKLLPPPRLSGPPPEVVVQNGVVEVFDPLRVPASTLTLRDVNLSLAPVTAGEPGSTPGVRRLKGMFSGDGFRGVEIEGLVDLQTPGFSIRGRAETMEISPELRNSLPDPLGSRLSALGNLRGQGGVQFELAFDPAAAVPLSYEVSGRLTQGRLDDPRLPHVLTDIAAAMHVDNDGLTIEDFSAHCGRATLRIPACRLSGLESGCPLELAAEVRRLELDRSLFDVLPPPLQQQWRKYWPAGEVDADVRLSYDGRAWRPEVAMRCLNVSFMHNKFPYRLEQGSGKIELKSNLLTANLTAYSGAQPVRLRAEVADPFSAATGWFEAEGEDIQLDERLVGALPEKPQEVVRSLDPRGTMSFWIRMWRDKPEEQVHQDLWLGVNRCSIRFDKFPYPVTNIRGALRMLDGVWTFSNLEGSNNTARISCKGSLTPGLQGNELVLNFVGKDVPLEKDLSDALSPHVQQVWYDLRPRGTVDLTAEVRYLPEQKKFNVSVRAQPQPQSASIEPVWFPYRMERLRGTLLYRDGFLTIEGASPDEGFKAEHAATKITAKGTCEFPPDGRWQARFHDLWVDNLRVDRDLTSALPDRLRKAVVELSPAGSINLQGALDLRRTGRAGEPLQSSWNVRLGSPQASLRCGGLPLENIHGNVTLQGEFDGGRLRSRGELALDSLTYKDCQLANVTGPIWIDDDRVLLGRCVDQRENGAAAATVAGTAGAARLITANLCGGRLYGDGWVVLGAEPRWAVSVRLVDAELSRLAQDLAPGRQRLQGKIQATADLAGSGRTRNALSGRGVIQLTNADVYELPVMIALLKILSIRPPDQSAFSTAAIDYHVEGEHIYFDRIEFKGDAVSLHGKDVGEMDFQSQIRLTFYATVGRGALAVWPLEYILHGAAQQLLLIHVAGTLQNPEVSKEVLPAVNQTLQQLRGDLPIPIRK